MEQAFWLAPLGYVISMTCSQADFGFQKIKKAAVATL